MTAEDMRAIALSFPGSEEGFSMGSVVFKANGKVLARLLPDERAILVGIDFDEREMLLEARPDVFHITPHYKDYRGSMVHLGPFEADACRAFLERRWREISPKRLVKEFDAGKN
jgi:hypothetical protein